MPPFKFSYSTLPKELKNSVLRFVSVQDSIKFLKTSKESRDLVLKNGPLIGKFFDQIDLRIGFPFDYEECYPMMFIYLRRNGKTLYMVFTKDGLEVDKEFAIKNVSVKLFWNFLNRMQFCRKLKFDFSVGRTRFFLPNEENRNSFRTWNPILPNIHYVSILNVTGNLHLMYGFFEKFYSTNAVDKFEPNITWLQEKDDLAAEFYKKLMQKSMLSGCKICSFDDFDKGNRLLAFMESFPKTNAELVLAIGNYADFQGIRKLFKQLIENGIPSTNPHSSIVIYPNGPICLEFDESYLDFTYNLQSFQFSPIPDLSLEAIHLFSYFKKQFLLGLLHNSAGYNRILRNDSTTKSLYFKKDISTKKSLICMIIWALDRDVEHEYVIGVEVFLKYYYVL